MQQQYRRIPPNIKSYREPLNRVVKRAEQEKINTQEALNNFIKNREGLIESFLDYEDFFTNFDTIKTSFNIVDFRHCKIRKKWRDIPDLPEYERNREVVGLLHILFSINKQILKTRNKLKFIESRELDYTTVKGIVLDFFNMGIDAVIRTGECMNIHKIGTVTPKRIYDSDFVNYDDNFIHGALSQKIDWVKTKENKKRLIAEGRLPYEAVKDDDGNLLGSNGGEFYYIFFPVESYCYLKYLNAKRGSGIKLKFHTIRMRDFQRFVYSNPEIADLYSKRNIKGQQ